MEPGHLRLRAVGQLAVHPLSAQGTSNDNLYYTGTPGQVFNPGSGLGYPDLAKLAGDFG